MQNTYSGTQMSGEQSSQTLMSREANDRDTFDRSIASSRLMNKALSSTKPDFYNPLTDIKRMGDKNSLTLPFHHKFIPLKRLPDSFKDKERVCITFSFSNALNVM